MNISVEGCILDTIIMLILEREGGWIRLLLIFKNDSYSNTHTLELLGLSPFQTKGLLVGLEAGPDTDLMSSVLCYCTLEVSA